MPLFLKAIQPPSESSGTTKTTYSVANSLKMQDGWQVCAYDMRSNHINFR